MLNPTSLAYFLHFSKLWYLTRTIFKLKQWSVSNQFIFVCVVLLTFYQHQNGRPAGIKQLGYL